MAPGMPDPDFDSVTEIWFPTRADYDSMMTDHVETDIGATVAADEERFLDRSKMRFFIVDERGATPAGDADKAPGFKVIALLSRRQDVSKADFIDYYETKHVKLIRSNFDVVTELWFKDRAGYEAMLAAHANPEVGQAIADDEANFLDRSKTRFFIVEESRAR
jgi:hypothetical protein